MQLHCKHQYHLSTLRVSEQAKITFGDNKVPSSDRYAETGRPDHWIVRSEIIWLKDSSQYGCPKSSADNTTALRNGHKNYNLSSSDGQYGGNLICLFVLKKFMLPCPCRSLSWEQTYFDFDLFLVLCISINVLNQQRQSKPSHCRSLYSHYFKGKSFQALSSMWIPILQF